jgi:hypothetical protein
MKGRDHPENPDLEGRMILEWIIEKREVVFSSHQVYDRDQWRLF